MSLTDLESELAKVEAVDKRRAAEVAYVLAQRYRKDGDAAKAKRAASRSVELFEACEMDTLEACAAQYVTLGGIALPSLIHADFVRARFEEYAL